MIFEKRIIHNAAGASYYRYDPSLAAAIAVAAFYSLAFALTLIQWIRHRAWVWVIMVIAAASTSIRFIDAP